MNENVDTVNGTEYCGDVITNSSKDFEQMPDIGTTIDILNVLVEKEDEYGKTNINVSN